MSQECHKEIFRNRNRKGGGRRVCVVLCCQGVSCSTASTVAAVIIRITELLLPLLYLLNLPRHALLRLLSHAGGLPLLLLSSGPRLQDELDLGPRVLDDLQGFLLFGLQQLDPVVQSL